MPVEWNVFVFDMNSRNIEQYNVFDHSSFLRDCAYASKKYKHDRKQFEKEISSSLMYYYWSKCEWEVIVSDWIGVKDSAVKVDVYDQIKMNWDRFVEYVWNNRDEIIKYVKNVAREDSVCERK